MPTHIVAPRTVSAINRVMSILSGWRRLNIIETHTALSQVLSVDEINARMASFVHSKIGKVVGKEVEGCTQFLGVKYATLKHRFAKAEHVQYSGEGIDATKYG